MLIDISSMHKIKDILKLSLFLVATLFYGTSVGKPIERGDIFYPMSSKSSFERKALQKKYGHLYQRDFTIDNRKCFYCKDYFYCYDHRPAISNLPNINIKDFIKNGGKFELIPSCKQCNAFLYNKVFSNKFEALIHLLDRYDNKIKKMPEWTQEEMKGLGRSIIGVIEKGRQEREFVLSKMNGIITTINNLERDMGIIL